MQVTQTVNAGRFYATIDGTPSNMPGGLPDIHIDLTVIPQPLASNDWNRADVVAADVQLLHAKLTEEVAVMTKVLNALNTEKLS